MPIVNSVTTLPQANQSSLAKILCGNIINNGDDLNETLKHLSSSLDVIVNEIRKLDNTNISIYGPFLGRSVLEVGATALIARLDPFKVLVLRGKQKQPDFELGKPNKSSIQWRGDVLAKSKINNLWDEAALKDPSRALLGDYYTELIWSKSVNNLFDELADIEGNEWIDSIKIKSSERLNNEIRTQIERLYSSLSKGIHHEFVIPVTATFDPTTIKELINDSIFHISTLGLMLSVVGHTINQINVTDAIDAYKNIQLEETIND